MRLATMHALDHIEGMRNTVSQRRSLGTGDLVAGRAKDGTKVLRQMPAPSSFTRRDAERAIRRVTLGIVPVAPRHERQPAAEQVNQ